ncbi:MAG: hypothetical protein LBV27_08905, partial [Oscillospiraceae bacterium]|nr:hypothetical protein [Oscillospiraceae bacterium]
METWKILLITILSAVVLGCIIGVIIGKYQVKRAQSDRKPLLSVKERVIYFLCMALGAGCILFGVLYTFPSSQNPDMTDPGNMIDGGMIGGGAAEGDIADGGQAAGDQEAAMAINPNPGAESAADESDSNSGDEIGDSDDESSGDVSEDETESDDGNADTTTDNAATDVPVARDAPAISVQGG